MKRINKWEDLTNQITEDFIRHYFEVESDEEIEFWWVGGETRVGEIFEFADYYFNFSDVRYCFKKDLSREQLFTWYNFCLENHSVNISLARFILSPQEEKHLLELKQRVDLAEKRI